MSRASREPAGPVLIVDDEQMVTTAIRSFLELDTPHRVRTYTSPSEALEVVREEPIHVVVADFLMPDMDGISFLQRVREERPHASRVLLTGYADKRNAIRAINEAGLYQYLEKPWDNEELRLVIRNGVERAALFYDLDARVSALEDAHEELRTIRRRLLEAFL